MYGDFNGSRTMQGRRILCAQRVFRLLQNPPDLKSSFIFCQTSICVSAIPKQE
jgi:hypothetical protein